MHQPPTIPEGDEENEGVEQVGEGTHFPHSGVPQQVSILDALGTTAESEAQKDGDDDQEEAQALEGEISGTGEEEPGPTDEQISAAEKPTTDDEATEDEGATTDQETERQRQTDEEENLTAIQEGTAGEESETAVDKEKHLSTVAESPTPAADESSLATPHVGAGEEPLKTDDMMPTSDDQFRSIRSAREHSARGTRELTQVDFEKLEHEEEEQDIAVYETEVRISREELLNRYQAAEVERDRLKSINLALQQRLADYLHKRKGADEIPITTQGNERLMLDQQQRYQKILGEIETLQEHIKSDQVEFESKRQEYETQIKQKKECVDNLKADYVKLVRDIASKAVYSRSGKAISNQEVEAYLNSLRDKEEELVKTRHENIRLKNQLKKRELQLKAKEELAEGLHMIDFEQLKIENQTYSEKIEERNEELTKLRKKISTTVQILSHIKEKLSFVNEQRIQAAAILEEKEKEVKTRRDELATIKRHRDRLRQENQSLKQTSGLIGNEHLLRDYEERYDEIGNCTEKLESLKKRHAEVTLMCKVLKKKISKV